MTDETIAYEGDLTDFTPDSNNGNLGTQRGQKLIQDSIREDGLGRGIVVDVHGNVVAGNKSLENAVDIGLTKAIVVDTEGDTLVVTRRTDWDLYEDESPRRYAWRDNKSAVESIDFDPEAIAKDLAAGVDLSGVFSEGELQGMLDGLEGPTEPGEPDLSKADEAQEIWQVKLGDVWELGRHRIVCGDCTDKAVVEGVMRGKEASLVITDPPYGVEYADKNKWLNTISKGNRIQTDIKGDHGDKGDIQDLWKQAFKQTSEVMAPGAAIYCFMPQGGDQMMMMMMMTGAGIEPRHELIWLKNNHVLGRSDYNYKHEPILYAWKKGGHKFYGGFQTSILEFDKPLKSDLHPTMKPVPLVAELIKNSSLANGLIYDPFLGSGTTLIAAHQLGRICYGCEVDEAYTAVTLQRYQDLTSEEPVLIDTVGQGDT